MPIDLRGDLGRTPERQSVALTSPGIVYKDMIIVGGRNPETLPAAPGDVRAYDVRTGKLRWSFHTIPHPGEFGYETWPKDAWTYSGAANNWAGMAVDAKRGIVYVPTGSAAFDFYGGDRLGDDLFANCLIALNAATGERIWHFQGVRHDLWDRDFPSPPTLVTVNRDGTDIDAVAQTTKQGFVYLFDRVSGKSLFPIEYRKYPPSDVPGEEAWLVCERRSSGERKYYLANLPAKVDLKTLAAAIKARWVCEQAHQQLKEELGLDHFEGRSWHGLHRHALMTMIAYAYLQSRRLVEASGGKKNPVRAAEAHLAGDTTRRHRHSRPRAALPMSPLPKANSKTARINLPM